MSSRRNRNASARSAQKFLVKEGGCPTFCFDFPGGLSYISHEKSIVRTQPQVWVRYTLMLPKSCRLYFYGSSGEICRHNVFDKGRGSLDSITKRIMRLRERERGREREKEVTIWVEHNEITCLFICPVNVTIMSYLQFWKKSRKNI